ncbi:hypothetical protein SAMN02910369_00414 [Lachnospiraceae bacterium NE2001]|nr:hypothetical protein SAMN02910369_00414 [Lachnospiraceae bacterium NE2001]
MEKDKPYFLVKEYVLDTQGERLESSKDKLDKMKSIEALFCTIDEEIIKLGTELSEHGRIIKKDYDRRTRFSVLFEADSQNLLDKYVEDFDRFISNVTNETGVEFIT